MRASPDSRVHAHFVDYAAGYFTDNAPEPRLLEPLALMFVDRVYRDSSELPFKDRHVTLYYRTVTRYMLDVLRARGVQLFYILDNRIRQDRFEFAIELMFAAGIHVVTPYTADRGRTRSMTSAPP